MAQRNLIGMLFVAFLATLFSCSGEGPDDKVDAAPEDKNAWTDSIFGQLNEEELYYQHLIFDVPHYYENRIDSLSQWITEKQPGGLRLAGWNPDSVQVLRSGLDTTMTIKPFILTAFFETTGLTPYPYWQASAESRELALLNGFSRSGLNLIDFDNEIRLSDSETRSWLDSMFVKSSLFPVVSGFSDRNIKNDFARFQQVIRQTSHHIKIDLTVFDTVTLDKYRMSNYDGLMIVNAQNSALNKLIQGGADLVLWPIESPSTYESWNSALSAEAVFQESTRRILNLKSRIPARLEPCNLSSALLFARLNFAHRAAALIQDKGGLIPFKSRFTIYSEEDLKIDNTVRKEFNIRTSKKRLTVKEIKEIAGSSGNKVIFVSDSASLEELKALNELTKEQTTLVCFSDPSQYASLQNTASLFFLGNYVDTRSELTAQQLSGGISINGSFVAADSIINGKKIEKLVLGRSLPEFAGIDSDTLAKISWAINNAMSGKAFPGCQVLLAKDGMIFYDRQFGHHSYERNKLVNEFSMYDLASVTKVVSTTLVAMKLYEMNAYNLKDSLQKFLPDSLKFHLRFPSTIRNITFEELLIHKSGMPAGMNILRYMKYTTTEIGRFDKYFCDVKDSTYCIEVAENFYLEKSYEDSLWLQINETWLDQSKPYKYSDVNMNTLYLMLRGMIESDPRKFGFTEPLKDLREKNLYVEFLYRSFYKPLAMDHTRYLPLNHYPKEQMVPTENERFWRKQLLQGHVHDPNAALFGGVAGNAGMFSTTHDLAILLQMLLNKGVYNGKRYLNAETVDKFTSRQEGSHRGLGWNKPSWTSSTYGCSESASMNTYGHTGFTGTCIWVDPDSKLVYIFLSNRVHPTVNNRIYQYGIRKRVHQITYDAMLD